MLHLLALALNPDPTILWNASRLGSQGEVLNHLAVEKGSQPTLIAQASVSSLDVKPQVADWSSFSGFTMDLSASSDVLVVLSAETSSGTYKSQGLLIGHEPVTMFFDAKTSALPMPRPVFISNYRHVLAQQVADLHAVRRWKLTLYKPGVRVRVGPLLGIVTPASKGPWVDKFGQLMDRTWVGKVRSNSDLNPREVIQGPPSPQTSVSGKVGPFKVVRAPSGKAMFETPDGKPFWSFGITAVTTDRPANFERAALAVEDPGSFRPGGPSNGPRSLAFYETNLERKFGANWYDKWRIETRQRLTGWGINTLGNGSDEKLASETGLPFTITFSTREFPQRVALPGGQSLPDAFDPGFSAWIARRWGNDLKWLCSKPNFLGFFMDGELPWGQESTEFQTGLAVYRGPMSASKAELSRRLIRTLIDPQHLSSEAKAQLSDFQEDFAAAYAKAFRDACNSLGIHPLILGGRDLAETPESILRGQARYSDVLSIDEYDRAGRIHWQKFARLPKPVLLGEFSFMALDGNAMSGVSFSQAVVAPSQAIRAQWADAVLRRAASEPNIIGAHWFCYQDQPVTGRPKDLENFAFGVVNVVDKSYEPLTQVFRAFAGDLPRLR